MQPVETHDLSVYYGHGKTPRLGYDGDRPFDVASHFDGGKNVDSPTFDYLTEYTSVTIIVITIMNNQILPDELFSNVRLTSLAAVEESLVRVEALVYVNHHRLDALVLELLQTNQSAFPAVISCVQDDTFEILQRHISSLFSAEPQQFASSTAHRLLTNLSRFLHFVDLPHSASLDLIRSKYPVVDNATLVIESLVTTDFCEDVPVSKGRADFAALRATRTKQKGKSHNRKVSMVLDPKLFKIVGLELPLSRVEADNAILQLLGELKMISDHYLVYLRNPDIGTAIKANLVSCIEPRSNNALNEPNTSNEVVEASFVGDNSTAFSKVQPMKSALYFDSIADFGDWAIFLSPNAETDLRTKHKKDKISFDIRVRSAKVDVDSDVDLAPVSHGPGAGPQLSGRRT
ncbi:hypothetical protein FB446DRAFT_800011 [Lentinula raphanica]|nr:hypothetical protein FB446DRAFT_800011 [Lentinula raphanica]